MRRGPKVLHAFLGDTRFWLAVPLFWALLLSPSFFWSQGKITDDATELARARGQLVFQLVEMARLWNARHGGLYAPVSSATPPNPHLNIPERDIETPSGVRLTRINPAYMTRQFAELLERGELRIHLTSLRPLNPLNQPDPWESEVLRGFEQGEGERIARLDDGKTVLYRYMQPLMVTDACLPCHAGQGYQLGDIRGGLSVTFPVAAFQRLMTTERKRVLVFHLLAWTILSVLSWLALAGVRGLVDQLEQEKSNRQLFIREQTENLKKENLSRKLSEQALEEQKNVLASIIETVGEGIYQIDADGVCHMCNSAAARMLGFAHRSELVGRRLHRIGAPAEPQGDDAEPISQCDLDEVIRSGRPLHLVDEIYTRRDGQPIEVECYAHPVKSDDRVEFVVISFFDVSVHKKRERYLRALASQDDLTGLPNRRYLMDRAQRELERAIRYATPLSIAMLDLDYFKRVNDRYGHAVGDQVLQHFAHVVSGMERTSDCFGRLGGEEFAVVLPNIELDSALAFAARVKGKLQQNPFINGDEALPITVSIGVASLLGRRQVSVHDLLNEADSALYQAKRNGRDRAMMFDYRDMPMDS